MLESLPLNTEYRFQILYVSVNLIIGVGFLYTHQILQGVHDYKYSKLYGLYVSHE